MTVLALADLIKSGTIRIGFNRQNITCVRDTPQSPGITGPCFDMATALAKEMRLQLDARGYDNVDQLFAAGRRADWDIAFVVIDPRQAGFAFTPAYIELDQTYLVAGNSTFRSVADLDRPGVRIAVDASSAVDRYLRANLKNATLVTVGGIAHAAVFIEDGRAHAYAGSRSQLVAEGWRLAGGRVLDESITRNEWAVAVESGRADVLGYVARFLEGAKNAGIVQDAIDKHKLEGARVAQ